jgi:hypothetical protein
MLNELLGILVKLLMSLFDNFLTTPIINFLDSAIFGSKDPLV